MKLKSLRVTVDKSKAKRVRMMLTFRKVHREWNWPPREWAIWNRPLKFR